MDNTFEALQDLYDIIEKCERRNVKLPEDVIRQINEAEENAFWLNHTQIKYDKMNIKLKKTRYKWMIYEYNPNLKLLKQVCNKFDFSGNNCRNITNFVPTDWIKTDKIEEIWR